jgi:hypothetical protein
MAVTFVSTCTWRFMSGRRTSKHKGLPTRAETWEGRYDELTTFLPTGAAYNGGYIVDHDVRDTGPKASVDLIVAFPPDFNDWSTQPATSNKVFSTSGTVDDSGHTLFTTAPYPTSIEAKRTLVARVHSSRYRYYAASLPLGPRFSTEATGQNPKKLRDEIIVTAKFADGVEKVRTYNSIASCEANVSAAVGMDITTSVEDFTAQEIDGTPWYECHDEVVKGYEPA